MREREIGHDAFLCVQANPRCVPFGPAQPAGGPDTMRVRAMNVDKKLGGGWCRK